MSGDSGDESPQRTWRRRKVVLRSSSDSDTDSSLETIGLGRRKRLRIVASDDDSADSGDSSGSLLVVDASSRRTLPQLRYEDESSSSSDWETDHSEHAKKSTSKSIQEKPKPKPTKDGCGSDSSDGNSEKCPICLLSFHDQEIGTPENCEHIFCVDCITEWSKNVNTCPVDRLHFDSIIVRRCIGGRVLRKIPVQVKQVPEEILPIQEDPTYCEICRSSEREESMLLCDMCDLGYHMQCLAPPMNEIPVGEWFCPHCAMEEYEDVYMSEVEDILAESDEMGRPSGPRPSVLRRRVSHNTRRSMRFPLSQQRNMDEPSTSGTSQRSLQALSSTSRRQTAGNSRVPTTRRRKTTRRTRRTRMVVVEYKIKDGNKFPVKKKVPVKKRVKRKKVKKRRAPRTVARRSLVRASVRARLATLNMSGVDTSLTIAGVDQLTLSRYKAGIPALSVLGTGNELDYFSDDEDMTVGDGPNAVATRRQTTSQAIQDLRQARRKMIGIPQPVTTVSGVDILSGIIQSQTLLHSKNTKVSINSDGTLKIDKKPQKTTKKQNESLSNKSSDAKLDLTKVDDVAKKTPAYGGTSRGGGNWNGNRGGFSRDQNSYNNRGGGGGSGGGYSNNGGNDGYQGGGNSYRGNYQGGGNYSGNSNFQNSNPWQSNPNLRLGPDGGNLMDLNRRRDQNSDRRDQFTDRRNQLLDRRDMFPDRREFSERRDQFLERQDQFLERRDQFIERRDQFIERRDQFQERHDAPIERRDLLTDRPPEHNSMLHHAMLNANRELHTNSINRDVAGHTHMLGRASLGVPWQPFATPPFNPGNTMARHSFGGFDNSDPLDMTVGQNTHTEGDVDDREIDIYGDIHEAPVQPDLHTHIEPLPEPPVFRFDLKPMLSEDEKSDSGLVIDTEKYDPMDPTNDESSSDEDGRKREKDDPHALLGSFMKVYNEEVLPIAENSGVIVPPKILDAAVQQVLTQVHRDMIGSGQSHESDGDDSEGDCPNYSIYSAASLNIANNNESTMISNENFQNVDEHKEKEEDLIQQEDDVPDSTVIDESVTFKEPVPLQKKEEIKKSVEEDKLDEKVSKRCPITPNKRTAIKIKLNTTPMLIKRHVLDLYADEDELIKDQEKIFDKPPSATDNPKSKSAKEDSESKDDKTEEQTGPTVDLKKKEEESDHGIVDIIEEGHVTSDKITSENEAPDRLSLEDVSPGKVTSDDEYSEKEDIEKDTSNLGSPEKALPLMAFSEKGSPENSSSESESPEKVIGELKIPELGSFEKVKILPENNSSVTEICNNNSLKTDSIDEDKEVITQAVLAETNNKMTESISGSEDERSYTPCLDENKSKETSFETDKENILEALGTEMISEDEENEIFSDHSDKVDSVDIERPEDKNDHTDKENIEKEHIDKEHTDKEHTDKEHTDVEHSDKDQTDKEHTEVTLLADKKKKKKKIEKDGKDKAKVKGKKPVDIPFKKLSKSGKERNYRDKDDKNKSKRRRSDEKDKEIRSAKERRKEKRKDLERYDVRNVVSDKKRKVKDPFGRDTSRPRSNSLSLSRTPSPASFPAHNRSVSLPRYTPSLGRCRSPTQRSISRKLPSPRRSPSPRNRKLFSPIPRSPSPRRKRLSSPRGPARKRKSVSPRRRSVSPRVRRSVSPRRRKSLSPKVKKSISLRRGPSISHRGRKSPSHTRKSISPVRRRRSTSRGRKRVRRSPSPKPRKKLSRKSRSRLRSSSRRRSPKSKKSRRTKQLRSGSRRRKSPKGKKTKQRSVTPINNIPHSPVRPMSHGGQQQHWQKSPAYHEDWSSDSPSLNSRMLSPGWTPPRGETPERRNLRVIVTNNPKDKRKREKRKRAKDLEAKNQHEGPSKEVFTSGNNILVSVNFNQQDARNPSPPPEDPRKRKRDSKKDKIKEKTKRRRKKDNETSNAKPIAIIDLDKSPFREITPSPKNVIVLSDSEHEDKEEEPSNRPPLLRGEADISSGKENATTSAHNPSFLSTGGPKTPPEPSVKFSIIPNVNPQLRAVNPLHEEEEEEEEDENDNVDNTTSQPVNKDSHKGPNTPPDPPNTPPSSPDAYDPFEPTKSGSASPEQSESKETNLSNKPDLTMTLESAQNANLSADDVVNARPITPIEKVMALLKSTQNVSPTDPNQEEQAVKELQQDVEMTNGGSQSVQADNTIAVLINKTAQPISHFSAVIKPNSPKPTYSTVAPTVASSAPIYLNSAIPRIGAFSGTSQSPVRNPSIQHTSQRIVLPSPTKSSPLRTQPNKLFLAKPSPIKSTPIKPMPSKTIISKLPLPSIKPISRKHRMEMDDYDMGMDNDYMGMDSPYSPGSSDFGDLFEPPTDKSGKSSYSKSSTTKDIFDNLFGSSKNSKSKIKSTASKVPVKQIKKKGKTQTVGVKMDDENLKIMDDLPSSAVEMQVKSKFLNKLNRQSRVVEEVKLVLKPHYNKKHVTKEQYKDILRSAVPKICHNRNGEINPAKIQLLVEAYVKKYRKRKHKNV